MLIYPVRLRLPIDRDLYGLRRGFRSHLLFSIW